MVEKLLTNRNQDIYQMSHGRHSHYGLPTMQYLLHTTHVLLTFRSVYFPYQELPIHYSKPDPFFFTYNSSYHIEHVHVIATEEFTTIISLYVIK